MAVVNIMEAIVEERLEQLLEEAECCKCEDCKLDMMAYALNMLQPKYVNSRKGELFGRIESTKYQNSVDIEIAISKAIVTVGSAPNHDHNR